MQKSRVSKNTPGRGVENIDKPDSLEGNPSQQRLSGPSAPPEKGKLSVLLKCCFQKHLLNSMPPSQGKLQSLCMNPLESAR